MDINIIVRSGKAQLNLDVYFESSSIKTAQFIEVNSIKSKNWRYKSAIFKD